ncbi:hypothetical protein ADK38_36405, partial [Streptomyces varsoviensis]
MGRQERRWLNGARSVSSNSGEKSLTAKAEKVTADGAKAENKADAHKDTERAENKNAAPEAQSPELHSGHK